MSAAEAPETILQAILLHRRPLSHISLTLLLPLSLLLLLDLHVSPSSPMSLPFLLYKSTFHLLLFILTFHSISDVVHTITASPSVPEQLPITLLWTHFLFVSSKAAVVAAASVGGLLAGPGPAGLVVLSVVSMAYVAAVVFVGTTWVLACVVAMMEDGKRGVPAWRRSVELLRGREGCGAVASMAVWLAFNGLEVTYREVVVVEGMGLELWARVVSGGLMVVAMVVVMLVGLVVATLFYVVCREEEEEEEAMEVEVEGGWFYSGEYLVADGRKVGRSWPPI